MITLEKLTKEFVQKDGHVSRAVDQIDLHVAKGQMCVFLGPSGCGKTTTLKMINRLISMSSGRVLIDGHDTAGLDAVTLRRNIGYVIQQIGLFPNMTISENITIVPRLLGWDKRRCSERAAELMNMVALDPARYLKRYPRELSGGQQQRIGVIRALAADPPVLLIDEPFGAVDPINRETIQNEFQSMQRLLGKTVIMVNHDIDEALKLADRIAVFRAGKILQVDAPDTLLARPADAFVSALVGQDSTLKRLLLINAADAAISSVTALPATALHTAYKIMDENDDRYITILDDDRQVLGYVARKDARIHSGFCAERLIRFPVIASPDENLRVVLSKMYKHSVSWMPVVDHDNRFIGDVTQDSIASYLSSGKTREAAFDTGKSGQIICPEVQCTAGVLISTVTSSFPTVILPGSTRTP